MNVTTQGSLLSLNGLITEGRCVEVLYALLYADTRTITVTHVHTENYTVLSKAFARTLALENIEYSKCQPL